MSWCLVLANQSNVYNGGVSRGRDRPEGLQSTEFIHLVNLILWYIDYPYIFISMALFGRLACVSLLGQDEG